MTTKFQLEIYGSGTTVVKPMAHGKNAHYHIGHAAADTDGATLRYEIGKELETWLNGGEEPWWMDLLHRDSAISATTPHGCKIAAHGPMIDKATPPSWGDWDTDDSPDAQISRGLLIDSLMTKTIPAYYET